MEPIKTSKGKLVKEHKCQIKDCKNMTLGYTRIGLNIIPICEEHKKYWEKIKKGNTKNTD